MLDRIRTNADWGAYFKAPLIPSLVFALMWFAFALLAAGLVVAVFPASIASVFVQNSLLAFPVLFAALYLLGLVQTFVLGIVILPFIPAYIPGMASFYRSALGQMFIIGVVGSVAAEGLFGLFGQAAGFALMCLYDYAGRLPVRKKQRPPAPDWAIEAARRIAENRD